LDDIRITEQVVEIYTSSKSVGIKFSNKYLPRGQWSVLQLKCILAEQSDEPSFPRPPPPLLVGSISNISSSPVVSASSARNRQFEAEVVSNCKVDNKTNTTVCECSNLAEGNVYDLLIILKPMLQYSISQKSASLRKVKTSKLNTEEYSKKTRASFLINFADLFRF
jgi:hypothetical protein